MGADDPSGDPGDAEPASMPPFLSYGIFTVAVYAVAVAAVAWLSPVRVEGPTLLSFTVGFLVFMTVYFAAMWAGWLLFP